MHNNLKLINILHNVTQEGYKVYFSDDFAGMITVAIEGEIFETGVYRHYHCGFPDGPRQNLENDVINCLTNFLEEIKNKKEE